jgi:glucokinase-like ROK family protein
LASIGEPRLHQECRNIEGRRRYHRAVILELVRTSGPISKSELARLGQLRLPIVSEIVDDLVDEGLIGERGTGLSTGGRPPVLFGLRPRARCAVGINVDTRDLTLVVVDLNATVENRIKVPSEMAKGPRRLFIRVREALRQLFSELPGSFGEVVGIGLALPAPVLSSKGTAFSPPSYPGWGELDIGSLVEAEFGLRVLLDNDANAAALGEHLYGAGRGKVNMCYIIAHRGIGGAVIVDGVLHRGAQGGAGEIGHTAIDLDGPRCGCGRYGCLEAFAGRAAIARRASQALKRAGGRKISGREPDALIAEDVIEAALEGDEVARRVLEETGEYLGIGISNLVNLLDPELVVLGGSTMRAGSLILDPAIKVVRRRALPQVAEGVRIVAGNLGEDAGAIGAAALVLRGMFAVFLPDDEKKSMAEDVLAS